MITKSFVLAGRAVFTLEIPQAFRDAQEFCSPHYTFKVTHKEASAEFPEAWFVNLLTGPDNTSDFTYVGQLLPHTGQISFTRKSKFHPNTLFCRLFNRAMANVWSGTTEKITAAGFDLHHEGKYGRCGRALTVPESIKSGFGPECIGKINE